MSGADREMQDPASEPKELHYPIRAAARLTGISVDTLRAWERRHHVVAPARDEHGRLYSEADVERLVLLHQLVAGGHAIGRVAGLSTEELRALRGRGPDPLPYIGPPTALIDLGALLEATGRGDGPALRRELARLAATLPAHRLARDVALPLLRRVGEDWHDGRITAAQEHLVTAELRTLIGALARLHAVSEAAPRLILTTPPGERHDLGTLAAALLAAGSGFQACYFGPGLPAADVIAAARRMVPRAVVLGYTGAAEGTEAVPSLVQVARGLPAGVECWIGGAGVASLAGALAGTRALLLEDLDVYERHLARLLDQGAPAGAVERSAS